MNTTDLFEMGWNDVCGNLKRAFAATKKQKTQWCKKLKADKIGMSRSEPDYIRGAKDAADAFLKGDPMEFKGPQWVVDDLKAKC